MISNSFEQQRGFCVGIPAYNESATIKPLIEALLGDPRITEICVADDRSTDGTAEIVAALAESEPRVHLLRGAGRSGQVAGWLKCARSTTAETMVFIDADSLPEPGAILRLARACHDSLIVSGRIEPFDNMGGSGGRFSAELLNQIRARGSAPLAIIGRFFAVNREWFLRACDRTDIIANDMWLACKAVRNGTVPRYIPNAVVRYVSPSNGRDFAAQRQRADAGTRQLRELGILEDELLPSAGAVWQAVMRTVLLRPAEFPAWSWSQMTARIGRHYLVPKDGHVGIWEPQQSTKRGA